MVGGASRKEMPVCKVKVDSIQNGLIAAEKVVQIKTVSGAVEEVAVSGSQVDVDKGVLFASLIDSNDKIALIELPREAASGRWRVRVSRALVS